jgi:hypothetical protein
LCLRFVGETVEAAGIVGVAAAFLVQNGGDPLCPPVVEQSAHVVRRGLRTLDENRLVADLLLLLGDAGDVLAHALGAYLYIADGMVVVLLRVALPHRHAVGHELAHGRLEIVVAHDAAGDSRCPRADRSLVHHQHVLTAAAAAALELPSEVVSGAETVDSGADDQVPRVRRECHRDLPLLDQIRARRRRAAPAMAHSPEPWLSLFGLRLVDGGRYIQTRFRTNFKPEGNF